MNDKNPLSGARTISKYLEAENTTVKKAVGNIISTVQAAANHAVHAIHIDREAVSDATDYLDGVLNQQLGLSQVDELAQIATIAQELETFFDQTVLNQSFTHFTLSLEEREADLDLREHELQRKENELEKIILAKVADAEAKAKKESTTSKALFESALSKAEKVFDQNKITRFVCSTISRFLDEFENILATRDVEYVTKIFQQTIEPFQTTKVMADKDGKLIKIVTNSFPDDCFQDLFLFFYKYYNELMDIYETRGKLPTTAEELSRIFRKKKKSAEQIIAQMHRRT